MTPTLLLPEGISAATAAHFQLAQGAEDDVGTFWEYPVTDCDYSPAGRRRFFRAPELQNPPKTYFWEDGPEPPSTSYNLSSVLDALRADSQATVWIVACEQDVWVLHEEGLLAFCVFAQSGVLAAVEVLRDAGVKTLHVVPPYGAGHSRQVVAWWKAGKAAHIEVVVHSFPLPSTNDLLDYVRNCHELRLPVPQALFDLPRVAKDTLGIWEKGARKTSLSAQTVMNKPPLEGKSRRASARANSIAEQADNLLAYLDGADLELQLFTDSEEEFFSLLWDGRRENYSLDSINANYLLDEICARRLGILPAKQLLELVKHRLKSRASRHGEEKEVSPRIMQFGGRIYLDLATRSGQVVEIGDDIEGGWRIINNAPVVFRRATGTQPLPLPKRNTDNARVWDEFRLLFAPGSETNWILMIGWLFGCMRAPDAPFVGLCVSGEQDSGKTERSKMLRQLIDPNKLSLADLPETPRDLAIQAQNRFILGFDNLSGLTWHSDAFCRIATDGNFATRRLHTNDEEKIFSAKRPLLLNGIDNLLGKKDLQRRLIFVHIPRFENTGEKQTVRALWEKFGALRPAVLGALLDAVAVALHELPHTPSPDVGSGMVDFAQWVMAGESALPWPKGYFVATYRNSLTQTQIVGLDEPFAQAIEAFMVKEHAAGNPSLQMSARELYKAICYHAALGAVDEDQYNEVTPVEQFRLRERALADLKKEKVVPANENWFGRSLKRLMNSLRVVGIECAYTEGLAQPWSLQWTPGFPKNRAGTAPVAQPELFAEKDVFDDD